MHETSRNSYGLFSICGQCNGLSYIIIRALPRTKRFWTQCQIVVAATVRRGTCARMLLILYWKDHLGLPKCSTIGRRRMLERRDSEFSIWLELPKYDIYVCYCLLFPEQLPADGGFKFCEEIQRVTQRFSPCHVVGWKICPVKCQESSERKREVHLPLDCFPFWGSSASQGWTRSWHIWSTFGWTLQCNWWKNLQKRFSTSSTSMANGQAVLEGIRSKRFKTYANQSWAIASWFAAQGQRTNDRVEAKADRALRSGWKPAGCGPSALGKRESSAVEDARWRK